MANQLTGLAKTCLSQSAFRAFFRSLACVVTIAMLVTSTAYSLSTESSREESVTSPAGLSAGDWRDIKTQMAASHRPQSVNPDVAQEAYLKASNTGTNDEFGHVVDIDGDTVVVSARGEDSRATGINGDQLDDSGSFNGAVYVFTRSGTTWSQQAYLKSSNNDDSDEFGTDVAISGDTIVVTASSESSNATGINGNQTDDSSFGAGAAYVFVRNGTTWTQQAYLKASNTEANDQFGNAVDISGDTIVVGAWLEDSNATGVNGDQPNNFAGAAGAAYIFVRDGATWTQQAYLKASNTGPQDAFGWSVAIDGDTVAVGARGEGSNETGIDGSGDNNFATDSGAVYVFTRNGTAWSQQAYVKASTNWAGHTFGWTASVSGNTLAVGAIGDPSNATGINGNELDTSAVNSGAAYVFTRSGTTWSQQAYVKASNTEPSDSFGLTVAVSGNLLAVGTTREASAATGVNGDQNDNTQGLAGAVYLFRRTGTAWIQQDYVKASNTGFIDQFGKSVSIDADTLVVGAIGEASNASGVNGDQGNNSFSSAGAAYVFVDPTPIEAFTINAGLNDAWVSADAPLQGFFFTVFPVLKLFFLSWFTFDSDVPDPQGAVFGAIDQRWVTALGPFTGDTVTLNVELTSGGIFNTSEPLAGQQPNYGTITIFFVDCTEAILTYNFPGLVLSGEMTVTRVLPSNEPLCIALNGG